MQLICISRGTFSGGQDLAERLAKKLGYACLSRDELIKAATGEGIQVGKLEMAMIKPKIFSERLALEKERYLAFTTAYLCDKALEGRLVYHGRTGHLLLPGLSHVLRVRVVSDQERRTVAAMKELNIDRKQATRYLDEVDEDWRRWVHSMYGVSWEDAGHYDITMNLEQMSVENAASALMGMSRLPDFWMTPASERAMQNLRTAAKARLALARDERTRAAGFKVMADDGVVTVTFLPRDSSCSEHVPQVLYQLQEVKEVRATMATTNILWVEESFNPDGETFKEVVEIATKWNAAVELTRLGNGGGEGPAAELSGSPTAAAAQASSAHDNGGIEDDAEEAAKDDGGLTNALHELAKVGRSGGGRLVRGGGEKLLGTINRNTPYSLVVIGDVFLSKGGATRMRLTRELQSFMSDRLKTPVVTKDQLKSRYLFGKRDLAKLIGFAAAVAAMYFVVFTNQGPVLKFLSGNWGDGTMTTKSVVAVVTMLSVPIIAYSYGTVAKSLMKLIKME